MIDPSYSTFVYPLTVIGENELHIILSHTFVAMNNEIAFPSP